MTELAAWEGPAADEVRPAVFASLRGLRASADLLDQAGAAIQRYATDLAEGHELGRRAELRVESAGLLLEGTRVIEPWGPASAEESERRRAELPAVQARVDLATVLLGGARGRLVREMTRLADALTTTSSTAPSNPAPSPGSAPPPPITP